MYQARLSSIPLDPDTQKREREMRERRESLRENENERIADSKEKEEQLKEEQSRHELQKSNPKQIRYSRDRGTNK